MDLRGLLLAIASFGLGALPFPSWIVRALTGRDLSQSGTGNVSVAAAFRQGGTAAGIATVLAEVGRGVVPVLVARHVLPNAPAAQIAVLIPLVVARYAIAKGGGVTNATWGVLVYSPWVALGSALTGLATLVLGRWVLVDRADAVRQWAARLGCASGALWVWIATHSPIQTLAATGLAGLLVAINLRQADDMTASSIPSLDNPLASHQCGEKAARLAQLRQAGFRVPAGWVVPPEQEISDRWLASLQPSEANPLIVRSSAIGEDSDTSSAAGQYLTVGPVATERELREAIQRCRESYRRPEAIAYRQQRELPEVGMAVLIQRYILGRVAGVAFSRHPLDGADRVVIEALPVGGKSVVSGAQTPAHWEIPIATGENRDCDGSLVPAPVVEELVNLTQRIEALFHGLPQDIEWVWDGTKIWILQSRPITNLRPIWTRTIAAEVIPGAIHPLTWSVNRPLTCGVWGQIFTVVLGDRASGLDFTATATLFGSHAYFNATLLGEIFRTMGLPEQGLEFLLRGQKMGKPPFKTVWRNLPGLWRLVQRERQLPQEFERDRQRLFREALQSLDRIQLQSLTPVELLEQVDRIQQWLEVATYYNILGPIGLAIRRSLWRVPDAWMGKSAAPELASLQALKHLADRLRGTAAETSTDALEQLLSQNRDLQQQFDTWLETYGYLSEVGTDIAVPTWRDRPETLKSLLLTLAAQPPNGTNAEAQASPRNPWQQWRAARCRLHAAAQAGISEVYAKLLAHLRWTFLALEARGLTERVFLQEGDIFFLTLEEVRQWVNGEWGAEEIRSTVAHRQQQFATDRTRPIPQVVYGNVLPDVQPPAPAQEPNGSLLRGIPASRGCAEGVVRIWRSLDSGTVDRGTVLVVPYTDAGWAPLLVNAAAIVAEVGGQLSHGAIIAREYGIPAVMNVAQAATQLQDGQRVRVDGDRGTVERL
jgi:pyruvate,water dikinase